MLAAGVARSARSGNNASALVICPPEMCFAPPEAERPASRHLRWRRHWTTCAAAIWCRTLRSGKWCESAAAACIAKGGFVLDGFPRTLGQAGALSQLVEKENLTLRAVVDYELRVAEIVSRLGGRRICEKCKAVFHVTRQPSRSEGICEACGRRLYQRDLHR